jgi:rhamnogalacturonyl hydrolase YesR
MKKILLLGSSLLCAIFIMATEIPFQKAEIKPIMRKVADWQIANPHPAPEHDDLNWPQGALYVGMVDWAELAEKEDNDDTYYKWLTRIGRRNCWQPDKRFYHADDIAVSQSFLDLYRKYRDESMLIPTLARTEWIVNHPSEGGFNLIEGNLKTLERWTWCDALFMAPPVYAKLYMLTGEKKYIKFMNREYKATYDYLFDKEENLFYRDWRYFDKQEANGKKVFWGRGNGWVLGGLVEILKELPKRDKNRKFYEELFVKLVTRVAGLQHSDGFWHASLLDPASYPSPETSCTTFIVYSIAYGINEELLDKETYLPVLVKGWNALVSAVEPNGKLGYVQQIGADPKKVTRDMTEVYGVGAFLMAGNEIYKMAR